MGDIDYGMSQASEMPDPIEEARRRRRVRRNAAVLVVAFVAAFCVVYALCASFACDIQVYVTATEADTECDVVVYLDGEAVAEWEGLSPGESIVVDITHYVGILGGTVTVSAESTAGLSDSAVLDVSAGGSYSLALCV